MGRQSRHSSGGRSIAKPPPLSNRRQSSHEYSEERRRDRRPTSSSSSSRSPQPAPSARLSVVLPLLAVLALAATSLHQGLRLRELPVLVDDSVRAENPRDEGNAIAGGGGSIHDDAPPGSGAGGGSVRAGVFRGFEGVADGVNHRSGNILPAVGYKTDLRREPDAAETAAAGGLPLDAGSAAPVKTADCPSLRGSPGGRWEQNLALAPLMQYAQSRRETRVAAYADWHHKPDPSDPINTRYRSPATYVWRDAPDIEAQCGDVMPLSGREFCVQTGRLGVGRVMLVGDSISFYQSFALLNQIGSSVKPPFTGDDGVNFDQHWKVEYECFDGPGGVGPDGKPAGERRAVMLEYVRNDWLAEWGKSPLVPPSRIPDSLRPWSDYYLRSIPPPDRRTLLVFNAGPHFTDTDAPPYRDVLGAFFRSLGAGMDGRLSQYLPRDIVTFRTSPSGHATCLDETKPFADVEELRASAGRVPPERAELATKFGWSPFGTLYDDVNAYVRESVGRYNDEQLRRATAADAAQSGGTAAAGAGPAGPPRVHLLDVDHATSLRPDGHISGPDNLYPEKSEPAKRFDCLHYSLPGPIDWFNNFLFANLADLEPSWPSVVAAAPAAPDPSLRAGDGASASSVQ